MVPPYKRIVTSSSSSAASRASSATSWASTAASASASWESSTASSSSSSAEVPPPRKKIKLSTRRTKSITNTSSSRKRKKSHPKSSLVDVASPKKLKLSSSTSSLANQRPPLPVSGGTFTTRDWLPDGWSVVCRSTPSGQKYNVFKESATGKKFYSKSQVLNYLGVSDTSDSNKTNVEVAAPPKEPKLSSTSQPANKNTTTDWPPVGWTVVVWITATGQKYEVFKETATRKKFYSKPEVLNYLGISDTSDSNKTKVKVAPPQKKQVQVSTLSTKPLEIPQRLYDLIQNADIARKSLKLNSNNMSAKRELNDYERKIHVVSAILWSNEELSSDWQYDPETPITAYVPKPPTPPKPETKMTTKNKTKKDIKITWSSPNYHGRYPLNNSYEKKVWDDFKEKYKDVEAKPYTGLAVFNGKGLTVVDKDNSVVEILGKFAVDTFNISCKMYVNEDDDNQVSEAEFVECKFLRLTSMYNIFFMTIEAIEQGILGVYETRVECETKDGARRLVHFRLTDRKPMCNRPWVPCLKPKVEYETVQDGSSDPQDYYELTGMVHRGTEGGGFNYQNPAVSPHPLVYTRRIDEDFLPNVSQLL